MSEDEKIKNKTPCFVYEGHAAPDSELVRLLQEGNASAWEYVYLYTVLPVLRKTTSRQGISFGKIMKERGLNGLSILAMLFEDMLWKKKLSNFEFRCPVVYWMRTYVMKYILGYCKKNPYPKSEKDDDSVFDNRSSEEDMELIHSCFAELWRQNPMKAYVFLLKTRENLSSKSIQAMLDMSSANYVDQCYSRAREELRVLRKKYAGEK